MRIAVLGSGAWGTALAHHLASHLPAHLHSVTLWSRDAAQTAQMQTTRCNARYLPDVALHPNLHFSSDALPSWLGAWTPDDLIIIATSVAGFAPTLMQLSGCQAPLLWLCKGLAAPPLLPQLPHEIYQTLQASHALPTQFGALSGPSFALEVAHSQPTALVAASESAALRERLSQRLSNPSLRVYGNADVIGVEVGGAVKNILAVATGLCDGLQLGLNARAALITRGLAEMTRFGVALGAKESTFMGLSGLGDLVLTATGHLSRNRQVGQLLAQGMRADEATASLDHVAEGVRCAPAVLARANQLGVDMPITAATVALLQGQCTPQQAVQALMGRQARDEAV